jgi:hypothetical protein
MNTLIRGSQLNKDQTPAPVKIQDSYLGIPTSFIRVLFDDTWPSDSTSDSTAVSHLYAEVPDRYAWPYPVKTRLLVYPTLAKYYIPSSDSSSQNLFVLVDDDLRMIDKLIDYRSNPAHADISDIVFNDLTTGLSKLIYVYLDLKINNRTTYYDGTTLLARDRNILENCYEVYVIQNVFDTVSSREMTSED